MSKLLSVTKLIIGVIVSLYGDRHVALAVSKGIIKIGRNLTFWFVEHVPNNPIFSEKRLVTKSHLRDVLRLHYIVC